jgi:hypothetical protein
LQSKFVRYLSEFLFCVLAAASVVALLLPRTICLALQLFVFLALVGVEFIDAVFSGRVGLALLAFVAIGLGFGALVKPSPASAQPVLIFVQVELGLVAGLGLLLFAAKARR